MTTSERIEATFNHSESGGVPLWGILCGRTFYEHVLGVDNVGGPEEVALDDKLSAHAEVYNSFGIDITRAQLWPAAPGVEDTHWAGRTVTADTLADFVPEFPAADAVDEWCDIAVRQVAANAPRTLFAPTIHGPFCRTFELMGLEEFSYAVADEPDQVKRLMEMFTDYNTLRAKCLAARSEVTVVAICDDMAAKGATLFPPVWMREHWLPLLQRVIEPLLKAGKRVIFHSDGKMDALIPDLIDIGVDGINPLEPLAGMDLAELKREYGRDVTLIGGVDCSQLLPFGSHTEIRDEVRRLLDIGAAGGGFIIGDSSMVVPSTPVDSLLTFYETVREYNV